MGDKLMEIRSHAFYVFRKTGQLSQVIGFLETCVFRGLVTDERMVLILGEITRAKHEEIPVYGNRISIEEYEKRNGGGDFDFKKLNS